jgi:hypothetical protein
VSSNLLPGNDSFVAIRSNGNVISGPLLNNGRPLWFHYSGFQSSLYNIKEYIGREWTGFIWLRTGASGCPL